MHEVLGSLCLSVLRLLLLPHLAKGKTDLLVLLVEESQNILYLPWAVEPSLEHTPPTP